MDPKKDHIYDTLEEQRRIQRRAELKRKLRQEFIRKSTDPHHQAGTGHLFDPQMQRFMSMNATIYDTFKPTVKSGVLYFGMLALFAGYAYLLQLDKDALERKCRSGELAYKDRVYKFK